MIERIIIGNCYYYNGLRCEAIRRKKDYVQNLEMLVIRIASTGKEETVKLVDFRLNAIKYSFSSSRMNAVVLPSVKKAKAEFVFPFPKLSGVK